MLFLLHPKRPQGVTPLTDHIQEIHATIEALSSSLIAKGKKVVVVIVTDGLPTDLYRNHILFIKQQFVQSLQSLEDLPVWLVIQLCTDREDAVVRLYVACCAS